MDPRNWSLQKRIGGLLLLIGGLLYYNALPESLFKTPRSTVLLDREGELMGARIAEDDQWRFPERESVPHRFEKALLRYEDRHFHYHPGFDPAAILRASYQNLKEGRIVSGASTITMQVLRLSRDEERSFFEKAIEAILATRLELAKSKEEILALYASHAPFGGNVVGLDAAAWRYFGKKPEELGWGEATTLAVLPNDPSSIHPGKSRQKLKEKRNRVLRGLRDQGAIDSTTCRLATLEKLPDPPSPQPQHAPRFLSRVQGNASGERIKSSLDLGLQKEARRIVKDKMKKLQRNGIKNAAALIMELESGKVRAYVGNEGADSSEGECVDMIRAKRSSGSILKPFLYGSMLEQGELLPEQLLPDIPLRIDGFSPENFDNAFRGAVPADRALARSLNVPAVHLLKEYGVGRFLEKLRTLGFSTLDRPASRYGLSLILGGGEVTLEELVSSYGDLGRILYRFNRSSGQYSEDFQKDPIYREQRSYELGTVSRSFKPPLSAGSIWRMLEAMETVKRPEGERGWHRFEASERIPYKTGTSYGHKDAWAVGLTPEYVVGVWVGNANGEGRSGLTGVSSAAPILFELFRSFGTPETFKKPKRDLEQKLLCARSGFPPSKNCSKLDTSWIPKTSIQIPSCPFHQRVHLSQNEQYRVTADCLPAAKRKSETRFVLPPSWEYFYRRRAPSYSPLPPYAPFCTGNAGPEEMALIHPADPHSAHYLPIGFSGKKGKLVFEASHRERSEELHWHLDQRYLGKTQQPHRMAFKVKKGSHLMTIVDEDGNSIRHDFQVMSKEERATAAHSGSTP